MVFTVFKQNVMLFKLKNIMYCHSEADSAQEKESNDLKLRILQEVI